MTDLTPDEILGGLRALVARSAADADAADDPVPLIHEGPPAPMRPPAMPPKFDRPGHLRPVAANGHPGVRRLRG